jgi:hypothetical protein
VVSAGAREAWPPTRQQEPPTSYRAQLRGRFAVIGPPLEVDSGEGVSEHVMPEGFAVGRIDRACADNGLGHLRLLDEHK